MNATKARAWLAENSSDNLREFDYRDLISLAAHKELHTVKTKMGVWQSIITRWLGHTWDNGEHAMALSLIHRAMSGITQATSFKAWPRVLSELGDGGQKAMGAYLQQIDRRYWAGMSFSTSSHWRDNLTAMASSTLMWVTPLLIAEWSDQDVFAIARGSHSGSLGVGVLAAWLGRPAVSDVRIRRLQEALGAATQSATERVLLLNRVAPALMEATQEQQASFYAAMSGADALEGLVAVTRSRYMKVERMSAPMQAICLATIYNRIGAAPWDVSLSSSTQKRLVFDLQSPDVWARILPEAGRNLVLLMVAAGVSDDASREICREKLTEVGLSAALLDIVSTLGLRSWPSVVNVAQADQGLVALPEITFG